MVGRLSSSICSTMSAVVDGQLSGMAAILDSFELFWSPKVLLALLDWGLEDVRELREVEGDGAIPSKSLAFALLLWPELFPLHEEGGASPSKFLALLLTLECELALLLLLLPPPLKAFAPPVFAFLFGFSSSLAGGASSSASSSSASSSSSSSSFSSSSLSSSLADSSMATAPGSAGFSNFGFLFAAAAVASSRARREGLEALWMAILTGLGNPSAFRGSPAVT
mmetsp:Transcript_44963/g.130080  ORF Transcript_44963/g.130080 Transcript_44963/m.130080 type:complete len:224 (+) Transcript_44963:1493-2164(+)